VILLILILTFGQFSILQVTYPITAEFDYMGKIWRGTPVRMGGREIGKARAPEPRGAITVLILDIDKKYDIKSDAELRVVPTGVLGELYFEFIGGTPGAGYLAKDGSARVKGVNPMSLGDLPTKFGQLLELYEPKIAKLLDGLNVTFESVNKVLNEPGTQNSLKQTIQKSADVAVKTEKLVEDLQSLSRDARAAAASITALAAQLGATAQETRATVQEARTTVQEARKTIQTQDANMSQTLDKIRSDAQRLEGILASIETVTAGAKTQSTVAKLLAEDTLHTKMTETLDEAKATLAQIRKTAQYVEENPDAFFWGKKPPPKKGGWFSGWFGSKTEQK
ncbi:MAG: MCE family protein, partial [Planctomycetes bacterium]|nr:MCE family protein [Planctomycetota bacterium]